MDFQQKNSYRTKWIEIFYSINFHASMLFVILLVLYSQTKLRFIVLTRYILFLCETAFCGHTTLLCTYGSGVISFPKGLAVVEAWRCNV